MIYTKFKSLHQVQVAGKGITVALCHRMPAHYVIEVSEELEHNENKGEAQMTNSQLHLPNLAMNLDNAYLSSEQKSKLSQMLSENRDMFAVNRQHLGKAELHYHRIDTGNARPVTQRFYRTSPKMRKEMGKAN